MTFQYSPWPTSKESKVLPIQFSLDLQDFSKWLKVFPKRLFIQLSTFVNKTRIESFYISLVHTSFDDIPRMIIFKEIIQGINKRLIFKS
jgi:hypothetical protein